MVLADVEENQLASPMSTRAKDSTHCKVSCGCFAYQSAYKRGQDDIRKSCIEHRFNQYADGYKSGVDDAAKIADTFSEQWQGGEVPPGESFMATKIARIIRVLKTSGPGGEMNEFGKVCEHGSLARSCYICELKSQLRVALQALEAIAFGSLEANFKQITQTPQEIAAEALKVINGD